MECARWCARADAHLCAARVYVEYCGVTRGVLHVERRSAVVAVFDYHVARCTCTGFSATLQRDGTATRCTATSVTTLDRNCTSRARATSASTLQGQLATNTCRVTRTGADSQSVAVCGSCSLSFDPNRSCGGAAVLAEG